MTVAMPFTLTLENGRVSLTLTLTVTATLAVTLAHVIDV